MKNRVLTLFGSLITVFLFSSNQLYGAQGAHEDHYSKGSHNDKTGAIMKKDVIFENIRIKLELIRMDAYMEAMGQEMKHDMPMKHEMPMMGMHTHGKIVYDSSHRNLTHFLIIEVIDTKTDRIVKDAQVDLRLTYPKGKEKSLMLHPMTMEGMSRYTGDLNLSEKGNYLLDLSVTREGVERKTSFEVVIE